MTSYHFWKNDGQRYYGSDLAFVRRISETHALAENLVNRASRLLRDAPHSQYQLGHSPWRGPIALR